MDFEQIIFWCKFIVFSIMILAAVIGGIVSYKNFPPKRWGEELWLLSTFLWLMFGLIIGLVASIIIRDHWLDIYNVTNPYL